jgi:hypothetical protein
VTVQSLRTFGAHATDFVDLASDKGEISAVRNSAHRAGLACAAAWSALKTSIIGNNGAPEDQRQFRLAKIEQVP